MSELRKRLSEFLGKKYFLYFSPAEMEEILSLIDSSPVEGLEVVRDCPHKGDPNHDYGYDMTPSCVHCHGTGEIVRPMTRGEMEEWAKNKIADLSDSYSINYNPSALILPSGGRVRVRK